MIPSAMLGDLEDHAVSDNHLPSTTDGHDPEVKVELTRDGIQELLALYSGEQAPQQTESAFSVTFEDCVRVLQEHRRTLLLGLLAGLVLGSLILLLSTPIFPVTAQVVVERHDVTTSRPIAGPGGGGSAFVATQAEVMQSRSVIANAVAALPRASYLDAEDDAVASALDKVVASPVSGTQVVALGYLGPDANYGVSLLAEIVESYRGTLRHNESESQNQKLGAKQTEIDVLAADALQIEQKVDELRIANSIIGSGDEAVAAQNVVLEGLNRQLADARSQRITLQNRLAVGSDQIAILDPATRSLQEQLWQAEAELARATLTLTLAHPAVEAAQRDVDVLKEQLRSSSKATPGALKRDIRSIAGLEKQLKVVYADESKRMAELESYRRKENLLVTELERIREMGDARRRELLDQRLLGRLAESGDTGIRARIIEEPRVPESAAWPKPQLVLAVGATLGLIGGFVVALFALRRGEEKIWTTAEVEYS